jgi:hypothetical protein
MTVTAATSQKPREAPKKALRIFTINNSEKSDQTMSG